MSDVLGFFAQWVVVSWPLWLIAKRLGLPPGQARLSWIPLLSLPIMAGVFAFSPWPRFDAARSDQVAAGSG